MRYRDPLAADRRAMGVSNRLCAQRHMTPEQIGALMRKTIHEALDRNGTVSRQDLLLANVPAVAIDTRFRAILMEVLDERANGAP